MKKVLEFLILVLVLVGILSICSCSKEEYNQYPCVDGFCQSKFIIDQEVSPGLYIDKNNYWHIKYWGPKYFTVKGRTDELNEQYVVNDIPLVETQFDSDYWVWFDNLSFTIPTYSPFGEYTQHQIPIPIGDRSYSLGDIAKIHPPLNIAGYQVTKNTCMDCPYSETLFRTYSKNTYKPQQQFYLDGRMKGDTLTVYVKVIFNYDLGESEIQEHELKIIVD